MVVANDVTRDSRVLREAAVLTASGHRVTILGIRTARTVAPDVELRDGYVIRRLPFRARPPRWWIPPDFYARLRLRSDRQYRIHRARVVHHFRLTRRRLRTRPIRLPALRLRLRLPSRPGRRVVTVPARGRFIFGSRRRSLPARARRLVVRAWRAPPAAWPRKARSVGRRVVARVSRIRPRLPWRSVRLPWRAVRLPRRDSVILRPALATARAVGRMAHAWVSIASLLVWGSVYLLANRLTAGALEWQTGWRWRWLGWARYVSDHAPDADVWHGHDMTSLPAVVELKRRRGGVAIYDSHEIYFESGRHADQPRWAKAPLEALERRLVREVDAVVTVNVSLAAILAGRLGVPEVRVLYNCPERQSIEPGRSALRETLALPDSTPLLVYHGSLAPHRGLEQLVEALAEPELRSAHLAFLGFGPMTEWLRAEARSPRHGGRIHVLDAVDPSELPAWLSGVDVAVAPIQPSTLNHRLSSPNKVFEAIAVGTPVAGSDFPEFRRVIRESAFGTLGELFDPSKPADIARAVGRILTATPAERDALRRRCLLAAARRWNWETESRSLVSLYHGIEAGALSELAGDVPATEVA